MDEKRIAELLDDCNLLLHSTLIAVLEHRKPMLQVRKLQAILQKLHEETTSDGP